MSLYNYKSSRPRFKALISVVLVMLVIFSIQAAVLAVGELSGSGGISSEPLVGGTIGFNISVTNIPNPPPGTYFNDRLYNVTGVIVLPAGMTLNSCGLPPSSVSPGPGAGETTIIFDNIKNLEVNEVIDIGCTATLDASIDLGQPFDIQYRWEANTLPDESGTWMYFPAGGPDAFAVISAQPQAFDLEKMPNPNTGEVQVNGAGAYVEGAGGTGVNWPYNYTLSLTNNPLNPSTGIQVVDVIPPGVAYLGNDLVTCTGAGAPASPTPARVLNGDGSITLTWNMNPLAPGEVCTFGYETAIPYRYRTAAGPLLGGGPFDGAIIPTDVTHENTYEATGFYDPPGPDLIPSADGTTSTPLDDAPGVVTSGYHSIAKSVSSSGVQQDSPLTYTINGWISEYYDFTASAGTPYVITDILADGLDYCGPGFGPSGFYGDCLAVVTPTFNGAPLNPVSVVQDANFNLVITWYVTDPAAVEAGDTWALSYNAQVRDYYASDPTQPVSGLDVRPNNATASGTWNDRITVGRTGADDTHASASVELTSPALDKQIYDPATGTYVNGPVQVEIGQRLTYRVEITFDEDLDMRNVIVDDFLPRGQRYVPNTADFTGSQDYPGTPQTAPGVGYAGSTYGAEQAQAINGFYIDDCPGPGRYPGSADPFYSAEQFLGGLQDLVWKLCRVDNSDSGTQILWQVVFDAVVVDDPALFDGYRVANFGNLSGTNSFGTTYSLRDNLDTTYIVPLLVATKTNNAPDPLDVLAGTFAYTINFQNAGTGTAYDWTIKDAIPAGIRIPGGGVCTGFATTAPGAFRCTADAGAQAGTGGFVTIQPDDGGGGHDAARPFPGGASYNFTFNAELAPDATPDETLTNVASIEYCTQPTATDYNADGRPDRRCIGYLDPDPTVFDGSDTPHSDEGTPPDYPDFKDYTDPSNPNGTDDSTVHIVGVGTDKGHIQPVHVPPQVTTGDYATIGEVYQVTLDVTIPARTHLFADPAAGYVEIIDTIFQEGVVFCDTASAITGCADPVLTQPGALVTPDTVDSPTAPNWWRWLPGSPDPGSQVRFFLEEINNSASDTGYVFTITFTMVVTGLDDDGLTPVYFPPAGGDVAENSFVVRYFNDDTPTALEFTTPDESDEIDINQPLITTDKEAVRIVRGGADLCSSAASCDGVSVQGGDTIYYRTVYTSSGETTAMDVSLIDQLPLFVTYNTDMVCVSSAPVVNGGVVATAPLAPPYSLELQMDTTPAGQWDIAPGQTITCDYSVTVEPVVPAGTDLTNFTDADWSTIDGTPGAGDPPERVFDDTPDDGDADDDEETVPVEVPTMGKTRLSPGPTGSPSVAPVRIGDVVQYQITVPLPIGETRNLVVRDTFDPGLILYTTDPIPFTFITNSTPPVNLAVTQTLNGTNDGIGAFSVDWALSDPACAAQGGTPPCIINDGTAGGNSAVVITFRAVVADVPLNVNGLVLDNTVSASYVDGYGNPRTVLDPGPLDDEEVQIIEPDVRLVKTVAPLTADAGDTLTYTVTITNTAAPTASDFDQPTAYDVTWEDDLDPRVQYVAGSMACELNGAPTDAVVTGTDPISVTNNADPNLNAWDLRPGGVDVLVCAYQALVLQIVPPGAALLNTADADWSSLDGTVAAGPTDPNERIYDDRDRDPLVDSDGDGDPANDDDDGADDADQAVVNVPNLTLDKVVGPASDPNYQTDNQYQPGQLIPYQITIVLPEGTINDLTITDTFNANLQFEAGSTTITSVPAGASLQAGPTVVGSTVTWVLNDIVYPGTPLTASPPASGYTITLSYLMRVRSTATNGATYTNTAAARHDANNDGLIDANDPPPVTDTETVGIETPALQVTKTENDADNLVDAGDVVTYTVTLRNTRGATGGIAYDVFFTENLDDDTDYVPGSMECNYDPAPAGGPLTPLTPIEFDLAPFDGVADAPEAITWDNFRVSGGAAENSNPWFLNGGDQIICTYQVTINADVRAGDPAIVNRVTMTADTADGDQPQEVTTTTPQVTTTLSVPAPTLVKDVDATAVQYQADGTYQPGELVPYVITVTVPEGQITDLNITDTFPAGFVFVTGSTTVTTSWAAALTPAVTELPASVTWAFGSVAVPGTLTGPTASYETITIRFLLRVTDAAPASPAVNTAGGNFDPPGSTDTPIPPDDATVTVAWPALDVVKTVTPLQTDAGDRLTYTVVITNGSANATLYDVSFTDNPNDYVTVMVSSLACNINGGPNTDVQVNPNVDGADPFTAAENLDENLNEWDLPPGAVLTCTYTAVVDADVPATGTLLNTVSAFGSTANGIAAGEASLTDSDDAQTVTPDPQLDKVLDSADTVYAPGEIVPYVVTLTVPEGTVRDLRVTDILPAGLAFEATTSILIGGVTPLPPLTQPANGATGAVTWTFGDVTVPSADNTGTLDYVVITLRYTARVTGAALDGQPLTNSARATYDTGDGVDDAPIGPDDTTITVEVPTQTTEKAIIEIDPDGPSEPRPPEPFDPGDTVEGGGVITYRVVLTNTHPTAMLYDVFLLENPPDEVSFNAGSAACNLPGAVVNPNVDNADPFTIAGGADENSNTWDLLPGQALICTYSVTVNVDIPAGLALTNIVTGNGSSADGDAPDEVDVIDDASTTIGTLAPSIVKSVVSPNPAVATIGQTIEYLLAVQLPIGVTTDLTVTDTLEGDAGSGGIDLRFDALVSITRGGTDLSGSVTQAVATNADGEQVITWDFTAPLLFDPAGAPPNNIETVEIRFTVVVEDIAANDDGDVLWNFVVGVLSPDGGATIIDLLEDDTSDNDVLLAVPALEVDKTHDDANGRVEPGQVVTFTVTVRNVGTGLAQNLVVQDLMPPGWTYVAGSSLLDGAPLGNPAQVGQALTWDLNALVNPDPVLNGISSLALVYRAAAPIPVSGSYTNFAEASGDDTLGNPIPEDNTDHVANDTDPTDDAIVTLVASAAIQGLVWHDADADGVLDGGEATIPGVTIQLYDDAGNLIATTTTSAAPITYAGVTYPPGSYLFTDLPPGNYIVIELQDGPILNWESTADADTPPGTAGVPDDYNQIAVSLAEGEISTDNDFGERYAGLIQGFVYQDFDGNGSNANPPAGTDDGIANVTVWLYDDAGNLVATTTTDATGFYQFPNLPDGIYTVIVDGADSDITGIDPNIALTPGALDTVVGLVVDVPGGQPVAEAHFPYRAPAALTIDKEGFDLNGAPLVPGDVIGWVICVTNPDQLPAPNVTLSDDIDTVRLALVPNSIRSVVTGGVCPATAAEAQALVAAQPPLPDTNTISVTVDPLPSGQSLVLYFETTVTDPGLWSGFGLLGLLALRGDRRKRLRAISRWLLVLAMMLALVGGRVLSQEITPEATDPAPAAEPISTEPPTPEAAPDLPAAIPSTPEVTPDPTEIVTPDVPETPEATEPPEDTPEVTETPTAIEETPEATPDIVEETPEATAEATDEPEQTPTAAPTGGVIAGRVYDDADASLSEGAREAGLPGVVVIAFYDDGDGLYNPALDREIARAATDDAGYFLIEDLDAGDYWLVLEAVPAGYRDVLALGGKPGQTPAQAIPYHVDSMLSSAAAAALPGGVRFAYALDSDGDGTPDGVEGPGDRDGDGIPNIFDPFDPSGIYYLVSDGSIIIGMESTLYADMDGDCALDTAVDQPADTVQPNPQTSADGGYRYDIRITAAGDPTARGIPDDGSSRCFFLDVSPASSPPQAVYPSAVVPPQVGPYAAGGAVVASPLPPTPPVDPATHRYFLSFSINTGQEDVINNHIPLDSAAVVLDAPITNVATVTRDGRPPESDDDTLTLNSSLECQFAPNGASILEPGQSTLYTHVLTNTGQQTDTYTLDFIIGDPAWVQSMSFSDGQTVTLNPGDSLPVSYTLLVPVGTGNGTTDVATITATSSTPPNPDCSATSLTTAAAACMGGIIYNDTDQNGVQDAGEPGLGGVTLYVFNAADVLVATLTTAPDGSYNLGGLPSGTYRVELDPATLPDGTPFYVSPDHPSLTLNITAGGACSMGNFGIVLYDPALVKNGTPDEAAVGEIVTFTITATNNSTTRITGVVVTDVLPVYLDFISASTSAGTYTFDAGTNTVTFNIGTMLAGEVVTMTVQTRVNSAAPSPGTINNRAVMTYNEGTEQSDTDTVRVPPPPDAGGHLPPTPDPVIDPLANNTPSGGLATGLGAGVGVGVGALPAEYPLTLPVTGVFPVQRLLLALGVGLGVFALGTLALVAFALLLFRRQVHRLMQRDLPLALLGLLMIFACAGLLGAGAFGLAWLASGSSAPVVAAGPTAAPVVNAYAPTPVPVLEAGQVMPNVPDALHQPPTSGGRAITLASWNARFVPAEKPAKHIVIPALGIDTDLVEAPIRSNTWDVSGFGDEIAHLEGTAYPGTTGNAVLAGHITHPGGFGPFRYLSRLQAGDLIVAYGEGVQYRYVVRDVYYVEPDAIEYTLPLDGKFLTLITCAGWDQQSWSYTQRLVVRAELG